MNDDEEQQAVDRWLAETFAEAEQPPILIAALLALQDRFGYLPKSGIRAIADRLGLTPARAYGVATFYNHFRFVPPGRRAIKVCMGTACHIKQADKIQDHWQRSLGIAPGEVTGDREYSLDRVACVGCCTLAPVTLVNDEVVGHSSPTKIDGILLRDRMQREADDAGEPS